MNLSSYDLARNLLISPWMNLGVEDQLEFYRKHWLDPVEKKVKGVMTGDELIEQFAELKGKLEVNKDDVVYAYHSFAKIYDEYAKESTRKDASLKLFEELAKFVEGKENVKRRKEAVD